MREVPEAFLFQPFCQPGNWQIGIIMKKTTDSPTPLPTVTFVILGGNTSALPSIAASHTLVVEMSSSDFDLRA